MAGEEEAAAAPPAAESDAAAPASTTTEAAEGASGGAGAAEGGAGGSGGGTGTNLNNTGLDEDLATEDDGYKAPEKIDLKEVIDRKEEDESLQRYKEQLLAGVATGESDKPHVEIVELRIIVEGRDDIIMALETEAQRAASAAKRYTFKEGDTYVMQITWRVNNDVCVGLKFVNVTYKMGMRIDKIEQMLGSYAPKAENYTFSFPPTQWPKGMLARGSYTAKVAFTDDDKATHLNLEYKFDIKKKWPGE